jgi:hypothetical protein
METQYYNPMNPEQDTKQKYQWCIHSISRSSHHFKALTDDKWSVAGFIPTAVATDNNLQTKSNNLLFYWRKLNSNYNASNPFSFKPIVPTSSLPAVGFNFNFSPKNKITPKSKCSTPAREVEEEEGLSSENQEMAPLELRPASPLCSILSNSYSDDDTENPYWNNNYTTPTSFFDTQNNFVSHDKKWR